MNFLLSDEQMRLQQELSRLLQDRCGSQQLHAAIDSADGFDRTLWEQLKAFGAPGVFIPEAYGGLGLEMIDLALVAETLGRFAAPAPFLGHVLAAAAIALGGDEDQKQRWLPGLASGQTLATVALPDVEDAWDPRQWTLAEDGGLTGLKPYAPNALEADIAVVGLVGGRLAVVDLKGPGVEIQRMGGNDLTRRIDAIKLSGAPAAMLASGDQVADKLIDAGLVLLAADAYGGATRCVEMATAYAQQREQFGVTISNFQALRHQLANMALLAEPCQGLYWYAAHAFDHLPDAARHSAALAKAHICESFLQVSRDNIEIHGGVGYTWMADPHIWMKRAMFDFAWLGPPLVHRARAADLAGW